MDNKMLVLYFILGGAIVTAVTYVGSHAKGQVAAFIAFLPTISVITLCTVYFSGGTGEAISYAKNMLWLLPPWVVYVLAVIFLLPRIGLTGSLAIGVAAYLALAFLIMRLT
jgi:uncharacterized membrane protein (GlpM family)